jgi:ABC-type glycerol-3-phosphate transport system substrate-binding protein
MPGRDVGIPATHVMLGPGLVVFKDSPHKDLAWDFIKECASHEGMEELARFSGRLPSRLSAFDAWQDYYRQYTANSGLVLDAVMNSLSMPYCPDVLKVIQRETSVAWHGLKPAGMAAEEMTRRINVFLDNWRRRGGFCPLPWCTKP